MTFPASRGYLRGYQHSLTHGPFIPFSKLSEDESSSHQVTQTFFSISLSSTLKDFYDYISPTLIIQDNLLILRSFSLLAFLILSATLIPISPISHFPHEVTYAKVSGIKTWTSLKVDILFRLPFKTVLCFRKKHNLYLPRLLAVQTSVKKQSRTKGSQSFASQDMQKCETLVQNCPTLTTTCYPYILT